MPFTVLCVDVIILSRDTCLSSAIRTSIYLGMLTTGRTPYFQDSRARIVRVRTNTEARHFLRRVQNSASLAFVVWESDSI